MLNLTITSKKQKFLTMRLFCLAVLSALIINVSAQDKAPKCSRPPMGWNSWNWFGKHDINEQIVREVIDAVASGGLKDAGYEYIVVDGGWRDTKLSPGRNIVSHSDKLPNGMKALADYAHSKGLFILIEKEKLLSFRANK